MEDLRRPWNKPLLIGSIVCGAAAFVVAVVLSQIVALPADDSASTAGSIVVCLVLFVVLVIGCLVMGYIAARKRTPSP